MKTLRVGVIGCGKICRVRHAPEYNENPACQLVGFYDSDFSRAESCAKAFGGRAFSRLEEFLSADVDAVSVCSANTDHRHSAEAALRAGKHVLCEKPLAVAPEDCESMLQTSFLTGKRLLVGHNQRLAPAHVRARQLIAAGEIGKVISFHTNFSHAGPEKWTGESDPWFFHRDTAVMGVAADLGIHKIDLYNFLTGDVVTDAAAFLATLDKKAPSGAPIAVDDNAIFILRTRAGALGAAHASWTNYGQEDNSTILYGTKGVMKLLSDPARALVIERPNGETEAFALDGVTTNAQQQAGKRQNTGVINEFISAITENRPSCLDVGEVIHAMRVVFAAARFSLENRAARVENEAE